VTLVRPTLVLKLVCLALNIAVKVQLMGLVLTVQFSLLSLLIYSIFDTFFQNELLNVEVNCTEASLSISVP
jgi:hypothetical protein